MLYLADFPSPTKDEAWPVLITIFALLGIVAKVMEIWKHSRGTKVHGTIHSEPVPQHAEQSDLDALTQTVNDMRTEITSQFRAAQQAGENRVTAITQNIDEEIGSLATKLSTLASVLHEKIGSALVDNARQSAEISSLQATSFRHDAEVRAIQQAIADLIKSATKRRHDS